MNFPKVERERGEPPLAALGSCFAHSALPIPSGMTILTSGHFAAILMTRQCLPRILSIPPIARFHSLCHRMDWISAGLLPARGQLLRRSAVWPLWRQDYLAVVRSLYFLHLYHQCLQRTVWIHTCARSIGRYRYGVISTPPSLAKTYRWRWTAWRWRQEWHRLANTSIRNVEQQWELQ